MATMRLGKMPCKAVLLLNLIFVSVDSLTNLANYTELMRKYFLLCGPEYFCNSSNVTHRFKVSLEFSYRHLQVCPECKCDRDCVLRGDCCPDLHFRFPEMKCVNRTIINGMFDAERDLQYSALMITSCPSNSRSDVKENCVTLNDTKSRLLNFPVTGSNVPLSFYNKYCAECNNVTHYTAWSLDIECRYTTDFNYLSSLDEMIQTAFLNQCILQAYRDNSDHEEVEEENCFDITEGSLISRCNMTGEWKNYDVDIVSSCESFYKVKFRVFKNVFCYMCNPSGQQFMTEIYESCNETSMWFKHDSGLKLACNELPRSVETVPFKNIFCYLCNTGFESSKRFVDVTGDISESSVHAYTNNSYYGYKYVLDNLWLNLEYFLEVTLKNIDMGHEDDFYLQPFQISSFRNKNGDLINLTNLLLHEASLHRHVHVCKSRESILPAEFENECECNFFCLFGHGINCCADIAIEIPTTCLNSLNLSLSYLRLPGNDGYLTIDGCFQENRSKLLDQRCSFPMTDDIFSVLPLSKGQTNFANIYCAICNIESDEYVEKLNLDINTSDFNDSSFINQTLHNYVGDFISHSMMYEAWGLELLCRKHLDYSHLPTAGYLVRLAKQMQCRIEYRTKTEKSEACSPYEFISKDRCAENANWTYANSDVEWACDNVRAQGPWFAPTRTTSSPFKIELYHSGAIHPNIFCAQCIPTINFTENFVDKCSKEYIEECFILPTIYYYYPYKNLHCLQCNGIYPVYGSIQHGDEWDADRKRIIPISGTTWFPILRNMFSISEDVDLGRVSETGDHCGGNQVYDYNKDACRNITCYDGKNLVNTRCLPLLQVTKNLRYSIDLKMGLYVKKQSKRLLSLPTSEQKLKESLRSIIGEENIEIELVEDREKNIEMYIEEFDFALCRFIHFDIFIRSSISRLDIEESLINFKNQLVDGCIYSEHRPVLTLQVPEIVGTLNTKSFSENGKSLIKEDFFMAKISKVLLCPLIEISDHEYSFSYDDSSVFLSGIGVNVPIHEYENSTSGKIRVCLDYLRGTHFFPKIQNENVNLKFKNLWIMSLICSIISVVSLVFDLTIYFLLPQLQTTPGKLLMVLMISMFLTLLFMQLTYFTIEMHGGCTISAALLHFFWISDFTCMFASNFHMFRIFTSNGCQIQHSNRFFDKNFLKYSIFIYCLPMLLVILNGSLAWFIYADDTLGYGGSKCFIKYKALVIATFICPVALICLANILFLVSTIRAINQTPNPESNRGKRNELSIYFRLTTITGVSWILQIIDSFLPVTIFTFIATFINSLQGLFVFLALFTNIRIWNQIRSRLCTKTECANSTKCTFSSRKGRETEMNRL